MRAKKGQGAAEYLILLAVVLIVGIVAIALLGGFAGLGGGAMESESKQYWTGSVRPFTVPDYAQINDTFYITFRNMEAENLRIMNFTLTSALGTETYNNTALSLKGGSQKTVQDFNLTSTHWCDSDAYDYFEYDLKITYQSNSGVTKTQIGAKPLVGNCVSQ
ncbi:hypothetical protein COU37_02405 [Candidatus Micrarchaeota archaeon CG10_big_fil_rev_8_21_14_0_10_45_29]|nr:MAG: hypothetical protein COU37_02405 [Candidatus Micrarchaeota archaeon CG10_big_fil_rev_8_21_14_0_10_45_29]